MIAVRTTQQNQFQLKHLAVIAGEGSKAQIVHCREAVSINGHVEGHAPAKLVHGPGDRQFMLLRVL